MNKNYEILITAFCTVVVLDAESEEKAMEYARDYISEGDFQVDEVSVKRDIPDKDLESAKKHADAIATP